MAVPALPVAAQEAAPQTITLRVQTQDYELTAQGVRVPGYANDDTPGAPALPVWSTLVELPPVGEWAIAYQTSGVQLLEQRVDIAAVPVPDLAPPGVDGWRATVDQLGAVPMVDRPDPTIYGVDAFYPASPVAPGAVQWQRSRRLLALRVFPFRYNPVTRQVRYYPDLQISITVTRADQTSAEGTGVGPATNPAAGTNGALRISTGARGLYRLTYDDLLTAGVPLTTTNSATFAMSYLGQPIAIEMSGDGDTRFEPGELVIFYAEPYQGRYQTSNVYWFTYGSAAGLRMDTRSVTPAGNEPLITTITQTLHVEVDADYRSDYPRPQDADHWFDLPLSPDVATGAVTVTRPYTLALDDALTSGNLVLRAALHGGADRPANPDKSVAIWLNSHRAVTHQWEGLTYTEVMTRAPAAWLDGAPNQVNLVAAISQLPGIDFYSVSPAWVEITYPALAEAEGDRIYVESVVPGANDVAVAGFSTPEVKVYDLRNPRQPVRLLTTQAVGVGAPYTLHFWDADLPGPTYALSSEAALLPPQAVEPDTTSTWRSPANAADYIAIVHPSLAAAVQPLLGHREAEGLQVAKVDVQDIYDEWSYGRRDPEAIRSFLGYAYNCWNGADCIAGPGAPPPDPPLYVLLVGDGHYDFTGASGTALPNLIPPYLIDIDPSLGETAADNRYVSVDGPDDYLPDMAIGRIPATSPADVTAVVDKIIAYETAAPPGAWQERVVFVADNYLDPSGNFHAYSDEVRLNWLPAAYDDRTIYYRLDYFTGAAMRTAIKDAFNADALLLQWFGHGSRFRWGSLSMFNTYDPPALAENDTWPFSVTYACWTGYFINLTMYNTGQTLGETLLLTPRRGSVADLSPSGLHVGFALLTLDKGLTQAVFSQRIERAGLAVDEAKRFYFGHADSHHDVIDTMVFFGDPALKLRLPAPLLASSGLAASRDWAPPGLPITVTATLISTAAISTTAQLTLTLPAELPPPSAVAATSSTATYDPLAHQVTWRGAVTTGTAEQVAFTSTVAAGQESCGALMVAGQVRDDLAALTPLTATVNFAVPDVDCDGDGDVADVQQVAARWGASPGSGQYHPRYDLDGDDAIGVLDIVKVASRWS